MPRPTLTEKGVLFPWKTAKDLEARLFFYEEKYRPLCQLSIDAQRDIDAVTIRKLTQGLEDSEAARIEQEPLLPWWAWTLIGASAGALGVTFAVVGN